MADHNDVVRSDRFQDLLERMSQAYIDYLRAKRECEVFYELATSDDYPLQKVIDAFS